MTDDAAVLAALEADGLTLDYDITSALEELLGRWLDQVREWYGPAHPEQLIQRMPEPQQTEAAAIWRHLWTRPDG